MHAKKKIMCGGCWLWSSICTFNEAYAAPKSLRLISYIFHYAFNILPSILEFLITP